jgi:DNA-binding winged helix-turn-helix (wHTH) protein
MEDRERTTTQQLFVGRESEQSRLLRMLASEPCVVVSGPAGIGKSALVRSALTAGAWHQREAVWIRIPKEAEVDPDGELFARLLLEKVLGGKQARLGGGLEAAAALKRALTLAEDMRATVVLDDAHRLVGWEPLLRTLERQTPSVHWIATSRVQPTDPVLAATHLALGPLLREEAIELWQRQHKIVPTEHDLERTLGSPLLLRAAPAADWSDDLAATEAVLALACEHWARRLTVEEQRLRRLAACRVTLSVADVASAFGIDQPALAALYSCGLAIRESEGYRLHDQVAEVWLGRRPEPSGSFPDGDVEARWQVGYGLLTSPEPAARAEGVRWLVEVIGASRLESTHKLRNDATKTLCSKLAAWGSDGIQTADRAAIDVALGALLLRIDGAQEAVHAAALRVRLALLAEGPTRTGHRWLEDVTLEQLMPSDPALDSLEGDMPSQWGDCILALLASGRDDLAVQAARTLARNARADTDARSILAASQALLWAGHGAEARECLRLLGDGLAGLVGVWAKLLQLVASSEELADVDHQASSLARSDEAVEARRHWYFSALLDRFLLMTGNYPLVVGQRQSLRLQWDLMDAVELRRDGGRAAACVVMGWLEEALLWVEAVHGSDPNEHLKLMAESVLLSCSALRGDLDSWERTTRGIADLKQRLVPSYLSTWIYSLRALGPSDPRMRAVHTQVLSALEEQWGADVVSDGDARTEARIGAQYVESQLATGTDWTAALGPLTSAWQVRSRVEWLTAMHSVWGLSDAEAIHRADATLEELYREARSRGDLSISVEALGLRMAGVCVVHGAEAQEMSALLSELGGLLAEVPVHWYRAELDFWVTVRSASGPEALMPIADLRYVGSATRRARALLGDLELLLPWEAGLISALQEKFGCTVVRPPTDIPVRASAKANWSESDPWQAGWGVDEVRGLVWRGDGITRSIESRQQLILLTTLLACGGAANKEQLFQALWPEEPVVDAQSKDALTLRLQLVVHRLRSLLGRDADSRCLRTTEAGYSLMGSRVFWRRKKAATSI